MSCLSSVARGPEKHNLDVMHGLDSCRGVTARIAETPLLESWSHVQRIRYSQVKEGR